jgi:uncharacterized protein with HEPN domain
MIQKLQFMNPKALKYILDIGSVIDEIELIQVEINNDFNTFKTNLMAKRALERELEIIGEAVKKLIEIEPSIQLEHSEKIIGLRNIIAHAYDSLDDELIWGVVQRHIPKLKQEIKALF